MATDRINMMDAVQGSAWRVARNQTALVRIGTVAAANVGNTVQITIGGSTFECVTFVNLAVGEIVAVATDTDAWWVIGRYGTITAGGVGPQGPEGPQGPAGATGPQGPAGVGVPVPVAADKTWQRILRTNTVGTVVYAAPAASKWTFTTTAAPNLNGYLPWTNIYSTDVAWTTTNNATRVMVSEAALFGVSARLMLGGAGNALLDLRYSQDGNPANESVFATAQKIVQGGANEHINVTDMCIVNAGGYISAWATFPGNIHGDATGKQSTLNIWRIN